MFPPQVSIKAGEKPAFFTEAYRAALGADTSSDGKVPVLDDNGLLLTESAHVADYVAAKAAGEGRANVLPATPEERIVTGLFTEQVVGPLLAPFYGLLRAQAPEEQAAAAAKLDGALGKLSAALAKRGGPYLLGAKPTIGDFMVWPFIERMAILEHYRGYKAPAELLPLAAFTAAMAAQPFVAKIAQPREFFVAGYAGYANPPKAA